MGNTTCLNSTNAFQDFKTFSECFNSWSNSTDFPVKIVYTETLFGRVIDECIQGYCDSTHPDLGGCKDYSSSDTYRLRLEPVVNFYTPACEGLTIHVNTDIAGPGVFASYVMQIMIIGCIWLALRGLDHLNPEKTKGSKSRMRIYLNNHRSTIRLFLIEFQEAQCFFVIAIQFAFIFSMAGRPELYGATNMHELEANVSMTRAVCHCGLNSVTFGLWLMQSANIKSLYTFICSSMTICLSIAAVHMVNHWPPAPHDLSFPKDKYALHKCGHNLPPLVWCGDEWYYGGITWSFPIIVFIFCCLFCNALFDFMKAGSLARRYLRDGNSKWLQNAYHCVNGIPCPAKSTRYKWRKFFTALGFCIEIVILSMTAGSMMTTDWFVYVDPNDWNLGQLITVTIWAPPIVKYLYWSLFGVESYSADRIPLPYKIINTDPNSSGGSVFHLPRVNTYY